MILSGTAPIARWMLFLSIRVGLSKKYQQGWRIFFEPLYIVVYIELFHSRKRASFKSF